eukprot:5275857-Amphidinium_carterae.1
MEEQNVAVVSPPRQIALTPLGLKDASGASNRLQRQCVTTFGLHRLLCSPNILGLVEAWILAGLSLEALQSMAEEKWASAEEIPASFHLHLELTHFSDTGSCSSHRLLLNCTHRSDCSQLYSCSELEFWRGFAAVCFGP